MRSSQATIHVALTSGFDIQQLLCYPAGTRVRISICAKTHLAVAAVALLFGLLKADSVLNMRWTITTILTATTNLKG